MNAAPLLFVAGVAHLGPDVGARLFGGRVGAWESVSYGIEASLLWLALLAFNAKTLGARAVCSYGFFEAVQRPICRAMLPMDSPPGLKPGQYMCDVATGLPVSMLSPIFLCVVVLAVVKDLTQPTKVCSSNGENKGT